MLVWGCDLLSYDPAANEWRRLPDPPTRHGILAWTGHELLGWGGGCCGDVSDDGSAYNPATNTWRKLAPAPVSGQQSPIGAWTGRELVIFNGHGPEGNRVGGAAYNPNYGYLAADRVTVGDPSLDRRLRRERDLRTRRAPRPGVQPLERQLAATAADAVGAGDLVAVWTGNRLIASGTATRAYDPPRDLWTMLSPSPLGSRQGADAVWTGREMIVWGGEVPMASGSPKYLADGAAFLPAKYSPPLPQCSC